MKILLDTNTLLWWFVGDSRLSARALAALDEAVEVYFSMVNLWEVGLKMGKGGYDFPMPADWEVHYLLLRKNSMLRRQLSVHAIAS